MVILSASGMATGGRVLHHLALYAGNHRNMVILTGYQAPGTRGARMANGARTVRIHGQDVAIQAEVAQLQSASAHADANQLLAWLRAMPKPPARCTWCTATWPPPTRCASASSMHWAGAPSCRSTARPGRREAHPSVEW
jgi:predicted metal-dependent RNase